MSGEDHADPTPYELACIALCEQAGVKLEQVGAGQWTWDIPNISGKPDGSGRFSVITYSSKGGAASDLLTSKELCKIVMSRSAGP